MTAEDLQCAIDQVRGGQESVRWAGQSRARVSVSLYRSIAGKLQPALLPLPR